MQDVTGKTILVLGAADKWDQTTEIDIVRWAHEMGLRVIVTDSQENWDLVPAKRVADEAWNVSWSDTDELERRCRESNVDGVVAGFSEHKVTAASNLAARLGMPFYTDGADTDTIFNKRRFKEACIAAGLDAPRSFDADDNVIFPVVVKPVDNAGGRGMSVCRNEEELRDGISYALGYSKSNEVDIEEYVDGTEVFVYYIVRDGESAFSMASQVGTIRPNAGDMSYFVSMRYPAGLIDRIVAYDEQFKSLIHSLGVRNCYLGLQCFVTDDRVIVHDPTFRTDGSNVHEVLQMMTGVNDAKLTMSYSLTGAYGDESDVALIRFQDTWPIYMQIGVILRPGTISVYEGLDRVASVDGVYEVEQTRHVGDVMRHVPGNLSKIAAQIKLQAPNAEMLEDRLTEIFDLVTVLDENGEDMMFHLDLHAIAVGA